MHREAVHFQSNSRIRATESGSEVTFVISHFVVSVCSCRARILKLFNVAVQTWSLFHNDNSRDLDSGNKPLWAQR